MTRRRDARRDKELEGLLKRDHTLYGGVLLGLDGYIVEVQARAMKVLSTPSSWDSAIRMTGMANTVVREAVDRISGAFQKYEIPWPEVSVVINLAPADLLKEGTWLDLPLAVIMLQASGYLPDLHEVVEGKYILVGEVGLHGDIRRVPGVLSLAFVSKPGQQLIVPAGNEKECALVTATAGHEGCKIAAVSTLKQVVEYFRGNEKLTNILGQKVDFEAVSLKCVNFGQIRGQDRAKEGALIAAAGGHNLLLIGPPGEGKSLLASAIPGILPRLSNSEKVDLTRIYSACGQLDRDGMVVNRRPMRSVHHTTSKQALVGGGSKIPKPGEITLSHLGVLFLDELGEFSGSALDSLRQPMEDGCVTISRVGASIQYPCHFTLVAAMNPCPCGYYGDKRCRCTPEEVMRYQKKISGPILDRIDLQVEVGTLSIDQRFADTNATQTKEFFYRVEGARRRQETRFMSTTVPFNAAIPGGQVREFCVFSESGWQHYRELIEGNTLSTRSMDRLAKVARTVADLYDSDEVEPFHVDKAGSFVIGGMLRSAFR